MNYDKQFTVSYLIRKSISGKLSAKEAAVLESWLAESEEHRLLYSRISSGESLAEYVAEADNAAPLPALAGIDKRIRARSRRRGIVTAAAGTAAAAAAIVAVLLIPSPQDGSAWSEDLQAEAREREITEILIPNEAADDRPAIIRLDVPRGKECKRVLPDGTTVWVNAESSLEFPESFDGKTREVKLRGEAYFEVEPDPARPFIIRMADDIGIRVLGTKFNVYGYRDTPDVRVTVIEGSVAFSHAATEVVLTCNRQAVFNREANEIDVKYLDDPASTFAWINGRFDFQSASLATILDAVAKWYDVSITAPGIDLGSKGHFTLKASRRDDITQMLDMMRSVTGLNYRLDGRRVTITI